MELLNKYLELVASAASGQTTKEDFINWIDSLTNKEQETLNNEINAMKGEI